MRSLRLLARTALFAALFLTLQMPYTATAGTAYDYDQFSTFENGEDSALPPMWKVVGPGKTRVEDDAGPDGSRALHISYSAGENPAYTPAYTNVIATTKGGSKGGVITFSGSLKTQDTDAAAIIWIEQQAGGKRIEISMTETQAGNNDWQLYEVQQKVHAGAEMIFVGVSLNGKGSIWADNFQLQIDGDPVMFTKDAPHAATDSIKADTEFQSGSGVDLAELNESQTSDLALLGQIWAFLKYHHPNVAGGEYHWDYELFRIMPKVLAATSREDRNRRIADWITGLNAVEKCDPCVQQPEKPVFAAELNWLSDSAILGEELSGLLTRIYTNRYGGTQQAYVKLVPHIGNPEFLNEQRYTHLKDIDSGYRILGLLRYWGMIEYWFPYRDVIGRSWKEILPQYLPQAVRAKDDAEYRQVMMRVIAEVNDSHAFWYMARDEIPPVGKCQGPFHLRTIGEKFIVSGHKITSVSADNAVRKGDIIVAVDGQPVPEMVTQLMPFYAASNRAGKFRNISRRLLAGTCGSARLTVEREGQRLEVRFERIDLESVKSQEWQRRTLSGRPFQLIDNDIAYIAFRHYGDNPPASVDGKVAAFMEQAMERQGIIFDLRAYPNIRAIDAITKYLSPEVRLFVRFTGMDTRNPGYAVPSAALTTGGGNGASAYGGKIVILIDESTQSAAEFHAMKLQAVSDPTVIGMPSAGADGDVSYILLPGGIATSITGLGVYYPDGSPTQRVGIQPDIFIEPTVQGIAQGRDEVLERAKQHIRQQ